MWTIGITDNYLRRRSEHGNPSNWHVWNPHSEEIARHIESDFLSRGMKGGSGGEGRADYVYVFSD